MFTGIVKNVGTVVQLKKSALGFLIGIEPHSKIVASIGSSIAINGICLTLVAFKDNVLYFDVSPNTLEKTTIANWKEGLMVNIEESLRVGDEIGGHFVLGHVDGVADIISMDKGSDSLFIKIRVPENYEQFITDGGSITIDGVSLTTNKVRGQIVELCIIPHTLKVTNIKNYRVDDKVNFEVDYFARNIVNFMKKYKEGLNG